MNRYTMMARAFGPYWVAASTPAGGSPLQIRPQAHRRVMTWCSTTRTVIGGMSNTCRREQPTCSASARSDPQRPQPAGSCRMIWSGSAT